VSTVQGAVWGAVQIVVATFPVQDIDSDAAVDVVVACATIECVVAGQAVNVVCAVSAIDGVVPDTSGQYIIIITAYQFYTRLMGDRCGADGKKMCAGQSFYVDIAQDGYRFKCVVVVSGVGVELQQS